MPLYGFELVEEREITEINSQAKVYRHVKTGAYLLCLENDDENKAFAISFATPPDSSTGVPHILEHSVLSGSENYPVKEPFKELLKTSLQTFLNAFTAPDRTVYPVASQNLQDLYNLVRVYLDAVFLPFITPETFQREGWHYELEALDAPLTYSGVVFNEMKGVYSSPDSQISRFSRQSVFPDNAYGLDSGGDPQVIPDLTYEQFRAFYKEHYHPSNAYIFFYGDDHSDERLRMLDEYLSAYDLGSPTPPVALQPRLTETRHFSYGYDAGSSLPEPQMEAGLEDQAEDRRSYLTVNWLANEVTDIETTLAMQMLSHILLGMSASPLRKALIDSGLGEGLTHSGYENSFRQATFSAGLKGIATQDAGKVEALILDTLHGLVRDGIDRDTIEASLNTIEFHLREANTGSFPRGLVYMLQAFSSWMQGGDPLAGLAFEAPLESIKAAYAGDPGYFEGLIQTWLLQNTHRSVVLLKPDPEARERTEAAERERLATVRAGLSEDDLQRVIENKRALRAQQDEPDSPEALATIPTLCLADLDRENTLIPREVSTVEGVPVLTHDLATHGIVYLDVGLNLQALPQQYLPYAALFGRLLLQMGTEAEDYAKLSQRIGRETGGIGRDTLASATMDGGMATWLLLSSKAMVDKGQDLLDILSDVLLTVRLDDRERLRQIVLQEKAALESALVPSGHGFVAGRIRAHFSKAAWVGEQFLGVDYLMFLRSLAEQIEADWPSVLADLQAIHHLLIDRGSLLCNVTVGGEDYVEFRPRLAAFLASMPARPQPAASWTPTLEPIPEGLSIPAQVNYVGKGANLYDLGYELHGSALVIVRFLGTTWLWDQVRVQGGAYGGFCTFDRLSGVFGYLSYRDPNLLGTLEAYDQTADFLRQFNLPQEEIEKLIIGVIGQIDAYQLPDAKGYTSMIRYLTGQTDELRQQLRDEVLATKAEDFQSFAGLLDLVTQQGLVVVMGSEQALAEANETLDPDLALIKLM